MLIIKCTYTRTIWMETVVDDREDYRSLHGPSTGKEHRRALLPEEFVIRSPGYENFKTSSFWYTHISVNSLHPASKRVTGSTPCESVLVSTILGLVARFNLEHG